jgi:dihydrofolate reductase
MIMGSIAVHEFISLDGVFEDPRWTMDYPFDPKMGEAIAAIMGPSKALLLGRRTYEMFAPAWSGRTAEDDPGAPFMNESQKYVVSSTLSSADWRNSEILGPYSPQAIGVLKERIDGNIYVSGSSTLVRALFVFPVALGGGQRLFAEGGAPTKLSLAGSEAYDSGVVHLAYHPVG